MKRILNINKIIALVLGVILFHSCKTAVDGFGADPYAGGKEALGVVFERLNRPLPGVRPNDVFEVSVKGLLKYKTNLEVFINEEKSEVVSLTDSTLEVRVPLEVSSGGLKVKINDQVFFGPRVPIEGNVTFDTDYGIKNGFNGSVTQILPGSSGNDFWILGSFTDFQNQASATVFRRNIHKINAMGESVATTAGSFSVQKGAEGIINSMVRLPDGKYMVAGSIFAMENLNKHRYNLKSITRLNSEGSIDSTVVELINTTPEKPLNAYDTLPAFNAYLGATFSSGSGNVTNLFATPDSGVIAVGNFGVHSYIDYKYSSRESKLSVFTAVNNIVRLKADGRVDSLFGYNNVGANGFISGAIETNDGKIVVIGSFTSFNGTARNRIVAFNKNGTINTAFNVGSAANDEIYSITYNKTLNIIALAGRFTTFNGQAKPGVVLLKSDGSIIPAFTLGDVQQRIATYAYVMNTGQVLVTGDFERYDGIKRSKLLILEANGKALQKYNNIGEFGGMINHVIETTSSLGYPALLIGGSIGLADGRAVGGLFKLEVRN
ncbi:DUF5008 domain-containing protein [Sphingobacterium psychroaquaticum]|uniref:DUF5008 domain-containing protein n=1 Tax=Sphingobacterium psychroaquaticum TaxID=561061 RepID=A0A1X7LB41_9SPHI|nr:DUF5008 domain-containing protein [Sphingobacterium psychroaquaticum]SMG51066.1 protein of unknown function [Sphingobacterium psychroaquaticum]